MRPYTKNYPARGGRRGNGAAPAIAVTLSMPQAIDGDHAEMTTESEPIASRPRFAPGYGIPENADGLLPWSWVVQRLETTRNYWIGSTKPDGAPHAMPVWALWVGDAVIFSTSPASRKGRNLARDPRVIVGIEHDDDVIVLEGVVEGITLDPGIADLYATKYYYRPDPGSENEAWYRLRPRIAYAWDRNYPRTVTSFSFG